MTNQVKLILVSGVGWLFDAMDVLILSYLLIVATKDLNLSIGDKALIILANNLGMLIGATMFGRLSDVWGRRKVFVMTLLLYSIVTGATAFVTNAYELALARFVTGLGLGGELPVVSSYVSELSPSEVRGRNVVLLESFWSLGSLAAAAIAYLLLPRLGWRLSLLILSSIALYVAIIRATLPEYLPKKVPKEVRVRFVAGRFLLIWYVWFALAFGYYGVFLWMPTILVKERGFTLLLTLEFMLITTVAQIPGYFTAAYLVEKIGRRPTATLFFVFSALSALGFVYSRDLTQLMISALALNFFNLGAWGVVYAYTPELFPDNIRGLATGTAGSMARVGMILGPLLYPVIGMGSFILITALWFIVPITLYPLPETMMAKRIGIKA